MLLPLTLVFAMISAKIQLIRSNALVSFYSLGYSRLDILKPFLVVSTLITILFISFHAIPSFSRADEFSNNIRRDAQYLSPTRDLFFTYKDKYIYFSKMIPLQERAEGVRVFTLANNSFEEVLMASSAVYKDGYWFIKKANLIKKPNLLDINSTGITVTKEKNLKILKGFRPKMLDQVYEGKVNFTIENAIDALLLLREQNVNTSTIRSALYKIFIYPFFVPFLVVIIFFFVPISARFVNLSLFSSGAILVTLMVWGVLFMLIELSNHKTIPSEVGVVLPIFLLFLGALFQYRRNRV
jgi:lipopolysaccharide export system permease protein